ncbi:hypothetical protein CAI16_05415 [Virgibacillus dokdonensis]|uniref:Phage protein, HK97 gp10 family n=1 Tax=Virgibacillus dokdonensis TaxID=302167 RepID=A0A3E0WTR1_9BACI|nr:HK97-gp10 family putative phage morphogenesis protein [Virgibacillus dokdonensis]RFA36228.1 hypothetical protein CAI16_05415 [Virgibacillus dokdonensis]
MIKLKGVDALERGLKERAEAKDVQKAIQINASEMQSKAQNYAPVKSGNLKRKIQIDVRGLTGRVASTAEYAPYVEWGTRFMDAQPHLRPAYYEQVEQFKKDLDRLVR